MSDPGFISSESMPLVLGVVAVVAAVRRQWPALDGWKVIPAVLCGAALVSFALAPWTGWFAFAKQVAVLTIGALGSYQLASKAGNGGGGDAPPPMPPSPPAVAA